MLSINTYKSFVFDCDGVILNSNKVKSNAFYKCALPFGHEAANQLLRFHISNGGISRYEKFRYFLSEIAPRTTNNSNVNAPLTYESLLEVYQREVVSELKKCEIASGLEQLKSLTSQASWCVVSGGDQDEVRDVLQNRGIHQLFNGGIFGSPDSKATILAREIQNKNIILPALFLGDSRYDYESSINAGIDFAFISDWSECSFLKGKSDIMAFSNISELSELLINGKDFGANYSSSRF